MLYLHGQIEESDKLIVRIAGEIEPAGLWSRSLGLGQLSLPSCWLCELFVPCQKIAEGACRRPNALLLV